MNKETTDILNAALRMAHRLNETHVKRSGRSIVNEELKMEPYTTGAGQKLTVHNKKDCTGACPIHNPSIDWPTLWRSGWGFMEATCPCGVGYPHPDDHSGQAIGHAFGTCGDAECIGKWARACEISREEKS